MSSQKKSTSKLTPKIWGGAAAPLLPSALRGLWCFEAMPVWVCDVAQVPRGSSYQALDASSASKLDLVSRVRIQNFAAALLKSRFEAVREIRVIGEEQGWSLATEPMWSGRTLTALLKTDLLSNMATLSALTFEQLGKVPGMGVRTILDFLCTLEAHMKTCEEISTPGEQLELAIPDIEPQLAKLRAASKSEWAELVSEGDLRFKGLFPLGSGSFAERVEQLLENRDFVAAVVLAKASDDIAVAASSIEKLRLEELLPQIVQTFIKLGDKHRDALLRRLGWLGEKPITLQEAGDLLGVSRERIRQIEAKLIRKIPSEGLYAPAVNRAVQAMAKAAPLGVTQVPALLRESGLTVQSFSAESLISAADILGIEHNLEIQGGGEEEFVYAGTQAATPKKIVAMARRMSGAAGAVKISDLCGRLESEGFPTPVESASSILQGTAKVRFVGDDWVWFPDNPAKRSRLRNLTRRMLSVVAPIHVGKLREGVKREAFYINSVKDGWPLTVPPEDVLKRYYAEHREFTITDSGLVDTVEPLDYRTELVGVDQMLIDVIRSVPTGVLDRSSFREAAVRRGAGAASFDQALTYSAVIERVDNNVWAARGVQLDPNAVEACLEANARRPQERRVTDFGWTSLGEAWFSAVVPSNYNVVLGIPAEIRRFLADGRFAEVGDTNVTIGVSKDGTSYGYGPILRRLGAEEGDLMVATFDIAKGTVTVRIGGPELGDED